jgi:hypothetical protein
MAPGSGGKRGKVARLIEEHGLSDLGDELEERWTRSEDRWSLRQLADYFNRELLRASLDGEEPLEGEVENLYRLLSEEDVTSGTRQQARYRIEQGGVDPDELESDFVSYQSIRTYLKKHRDASPPDTSGSPEDQLDRKRETIQRLTNRLNTVAEQSLLELRKAGHVTLGEFNVIVTVRVHCSDCGSRMAITELLADGGCDCEEG